jgi:glycosyltransferase involved in cell wall biosynthesis
VKLEVLFVGSFQTTQEGRGGGQNTACELIVDSDLSNMIEWHLFDTTQNSNIVPSLTFRIIRGIARIKDYIKLMLSKKIKTALIFTSFEAPSIVEKGIMLLASGYYMNNVIVSIRSEITSQSIIKNLFIKYIFKKVDIVICQSNRARQDLCKIIGNNNVNTIIIPNWVDIKNYSNKRYDNLLSFSEERPLVIVYAGWLESSKGLNELVFAVSTLIKNGIHLQLHLFGDGAMYDIIQQRIAVDGISEYIYMHGWTSKSDLIDAYLNKDLFVLPSYTEGMPNSVLEAMATGIPILATNVGGIPELVENGINGLLFQKQSVDAIESTIKKIYFDPQCIERMGKQGRKLAESRHDRDSAMRTLAGLLLH